jgi:hypothetical protein
MTAFMVPTSRPLRLTGAIWTSRTCAEVQRPAAPHPVTTLPARKTFEESARPVIAPPSVKRAVQARNRFVGRKMVANLPIRGFVHEEAIYCIVSDTCISCCERAHHIAGIEPCSCRSVCMKIFGYFAIDCSNHGTIASEQEEYTDVGYNDSPELCWTLA